MSNLAFADYESAKQAHCEEGGYLLVDGARYVVTTDPQSMWGRSAEQVAYLDGASDRCDWDETLVGDDYPGGKPDAA